MAYFSKRVTPARLLASAVIGVGITGNAMALDKPGADEKPASVQNAVYNGISCDHVRAKVAESGVTAAYAYARYMGMTSRDIARVRKACSV